MDFVFHDSLLWPADAEQVAKSQVALLRTHSDVGSRKASSMQC